MLHGFCNTVRSRAHRAVGPGRRCRLQVDDSLDPWESYGSVRSPPPPPVFETQSSRATTAACSPTSSGVVRHRAPSYCALGKTASVKAEPTPDASLAEYEMTNASYLHYDSFRWSAGSFLIAGVFLFWGSLLSGGSPNLFAPATVLVTCVMTGWIYYAHHYRQLYLCKLDRLQELEEQLGMASHLRFVDASGDPTYRSFGPRGHTIDLAVYVSVSLGGPLLWFAREGFSVVQLLAALAVAGACIHVRHNERLIQRQLDEHGSGPVRRERRAVRPS